ncbi:DUF397 domain-containing protein [Kitasatospora indigofera]|uniref:DUF397 domain-containing protein n=1 Tax=Kitasatospora indigofera TaxID=67307 RepID=UPI0036CD0E57
MRRSYGWSGRWGSRPGPPCTRRPFRCRPSGPDSPTGPTSEVSGTEPCSVAGYDRRRTSEGMSARSDEEGERMAVPKIAALGWYKSSYSAQANDCVETGRIVAGGMAVRDSKDHGAPPCCSPPRPGRPSSPGSRRARFRPSD